MIDKRLNRAMLNSRQAIKLESKESTSTSMLFAILDLSLPKRLGLVSRNVNDVSDFQKPPLSPSTWNAMCIGNEAFSNHSILESVFKCMRFLTIVFSDRFRVDARTKRIERYAFSNDNTLVWTGPG